MTDQNVLLDIEQAAMRLLAMHEHTTRGLTIKLLKKDFEEADIEKVLADLSRRNLLSDERFATQYLHLRSSKGYGPVRIEQEMREKGVPDDVIDESMSTFDNSWQDLLKTALNKKFGSRPADSYSDRAKRARFLEYRGFSSGMIRDTLFDVSAY